ncbi:MAG: PQQ-dependent sugar dehydrogenase [Candidatus Blackburnbacteria bacterium]|nr:PQQ-dependent sugar dehydrogenase [Candidatus Blackburnbacteria bacterium]
MAILYFRFDSDLAKVERINEHFKKEFGRIRDVVVGPDNMLYMTTSNRDGRGNRLANDDTIICDDQIQVLFQRDDGAKQRAFFRVSRDS